MNMAVTVPCRDVFVCDP